MDSLINIDFHIHSNFSDGMFSPEILAGELADADVKYAALTDHDSIDGLQRFKDAAVPKGIQCVNGVEISASRDGDIYHLLAYGFDETDKPLHRQLVHNYKHLHPGVYAWLDKARCLWSNLAGKDLPQASCLIPVADAISLVHSAGGRAFLAHPLTFHQGDEQFDDLLGELKQQGLDGLEAYYKQYSNQQRQSLLEDAERYNLAVCSGSDFHGTIQPRLMDPGLSMPQEHLQQFLQILDITDKR